MSLVKSALFWSIPSFLKNGGFGLLKDNCTQTQTVVGIIEHIDSPSNRFPGFKLSHNYGADIVIADKCFFIIASNNLTEGDSVAITYLPHSQFVLSIHSTERDSGGQGDGSVVPADEPKIDPK